ncbi:MAG: hypothetical protein K1W02_00555 [Muribaculaceae bacterium]
MNGNRIIKAIYVAALGFGSLLPFSSCGNVKTDNGEAMADQLFEKSANVIKGYTDSLANVADSATLRRLKDGFNEKMSKINFQFPADTDLKLSEEENDSLIRLIDRLVETIREKEAALVKDSICNPLPGDSTLVSSLTPPSRNASN